MKVLLLSKYGRLGASSRLRSYQYLPYLSQNGVDVIVCPLLDDQYVSDLYAKRPKSKKRIAAAYLARLRQIRSLSGFDLVWLEKEALPWLPFAFESRLFRSGVPVVTDYDDAIFHNYDLSTNPYSKKLLKNKIALVMKQSAAVIAGNPYIAAYARDAGASEVHILPTVVDIRKYAATSPPGDGFTIGWIGTPSTVKYLHLVEDALAEIQKRHKVQVTTVGAAVNMAKVQVNHIPWSEDTEGNAITSFSVGIMPLPDEPFERGKCGYKLIQYMACAKPVVASPVGINCEIVSPDCGFLAQSPDDWVQAIEQLIANPDLLTEMGRSGRSRVEERYSLDAAAPRLLAILTETAKRAR